MAARLVQMNGAEFLRKILAGERDFSGIKLKQSTTLPLHECFDELQKYLTAQDLRANPLVLTGSEFVCVGAAGFNLSYSRARSATFIHTNLDEADLRESDFSYASIGDSTVSRANLEGAKFEGANLWHTDFFQSNLRNTYFAQASLEGANFVCADLERANFQQADLRAADFSGANLSNAYFLRADLTEANLKMATGLENAVYLGYAYFLKTVVTPTEKKIIKTALSGRSLFDVSE